MLHHRGHGAYYSSNNSFSFLVSRKRLICVYLCSSASICVNLCHTSISVSSVLSVVRHYCCLVTVQWAMSTLICPPYGLPPADKVVEKFRPGSIILNMNQNAEAGKMSHSRYAAGIFIAAALIGCAGPRIWVTVRPQFDYQKIHTIAVLPFENKSGCADAGQVVSEKLTALLLQRGPYTMAPGETPKVDPQKDYLSPGGDMAPAVAAELGRSAGAEALLIGAVLNYKSDRFHEVRFYGAPFGFDESMHEAYYDEIPVDWYKIDAVVEARIRLIDASTGKVIWSDSRTGTSSSYGAPPAMDEAEVLDQAADSAARKLLLGLVPHEQRVRVPRGSPVVCGAFIDHAVDIRSTFTPRDDSLYVVIELDREFAGKEILMKIDKADTGVNISEERCAWEGGSDTHAFKENIKTLVAKGGFGKYRAAYFVSGTRISEADFHIRKE